MATTYVTLTGNVRDLIAGEYDPGSTKVLLRHNTTFVVDPDDGALRTGSAVVLAADDGSFTLPEVIASVDTVENLQATLVVDYRDAASRTRARESFGPYDLSAETGTVDLVELEETQHLDPSFVSVTMTQMQELLDGMTEISGLSGEDGAVGALVAGTGGAGPITRAALSASYGVPLSASLTDATFDTLLAGLDSGARVFIPKGVTVELGASHTLTQPVTIDGPGTILDTRTTPTSALFVIPPAASGTTITCPIEGSLSAEYVETHNAILISGTDNGAGVAPTYVTDVVIDVPSVSGFGRFAVRGTFAKDCNVKIGDAGNLGHGGILMDSSEAINARIDILHDITPGGDEVYGIQFTRTGATDLTRYPRCSNCTGHIEVARDAPLMNMLGTHGGQGIHLSFGSAYGIKRVIDIVSSNGDAATALYAPKDVSFYGGYADSGVTDGTMDSAVVIAGAYYSGAVVEYATGISGHVDTLRGYGLDSDSLSGATYIRTTQGLDVSFGTIIEPSPRAVHLYHTNLDFNVQVGTIIDAWSDVQTYADFITFTSNTNKGNVVALSATRGSKSATKVNTRGVAVVAAAHANTRIRLGSAVDLTAATTKVTGNVTGVIPWDVAQVGVVIDGTLTALFYAGNILMSAGQKIITSAPTTSGTGFRLTSGSADPTSPDVGDLWLRSDGLKCNVAAVTRRVFTGFEATATLNYSSIAAGATAELTVTVTGAATGDAVSVGPPAAVEAGLVWSGYVSATDTVTIRLHNTTGSAIDPASASWKVRVIK